MDVSFAIKNNWKADLFVLKLRNILYRISYYLESWRKDNTDSISKLTEKDLDLGAFMSQVHM